MTDKHTHLPSTDVSGVDAAIMAGATVTTTKTDGADGRLKPTPAELQRHLEKFMPTSGYNLPHLQKQHREAVMQVWDMYYPREESPEKEAQRTKEVQRTKEALRKKIVALRRKGVSVEDVSEELGISVETVFEVQA
jgi:hypothetical protein